MPPTGGAAGPVGLVLAIAYLAGVGAFDTSQCTAALGMQSRAIPDQDISASSSFHVGNVGPHRARIRTEGHGGAWCPQQQATADPSEWLQVELHSVHVITAVETQGRFGNGQGQEYAEAFILEYWRPSLDKWVRYRDQEGEEVLKGNHNPYTEEKRVLLPPIWASRLRFLPYSYHRRTVCMRVELYGCPWRGGVVSYAMPQGDKRGASWEFFDTSYDGPWDPQPHKGLGQLTDTIYGDDNFKMSYYESDKGGQGWVGWRNDSRAGQPVEIVFEFDTVREFRSMDIFCNNQFTKEVQVFSEAQVMFSVSGHNFPGQPITYTYREDRIFESSRNVSIKLHHRVGRFVKLRLHFANKWMLISEISFDSVVAHGNFSDENHILLPDVEPPSDRVQDDVFVEKVLNKASPSPTLHAGGSPTRSSSDQGAESPAAQPPQQPETPISAVEKEDTTYVAVIIGILMAVVIILLVAVFLVYTRSRHRKGFLGALISKTSSSAHHHQGHHLSSLKKAPSFAGSYGVVKDFEHKSYLVATAGAGGQKSTLLTNGGTLGGSGVSLPQSGANGDMTHLLDSKCNYYHEPFPFYSYSTVVSELRKNGAPVLNETQYAVPETTPSNSTPLLAPEDTLPGLPPFPGPAPSPSGPPSDAMSPMTATGMGGIGSSATLGGALGGTLGAGGFAFASSASDKGSSLHSRKGSLSDDGLKTKRVRGDAVPEEAPAVRDSARVRAPPPADAGPARGGRLRHAVRGRGRGHRGLWRRRLHRGAPGGRQVPQPGRQREGKAGLPARRAAAVRPRGPQPGARAGAVHARRAAVRGPGVPAARGPAPLPQLAVARHVRGPAQPQGGPAHHAGLRHAALHGHAGGLRHEVPRVAQLRAPGPGGAQLPGRRRLPRQDLRLRHRQRGVRRRLLPARGQPGAAGAVDGGRVALHGQVLHQERRVGLRRHAVGDAALLPRGALPRAQQPAGGGQPGAPAPGRRAPVQPAAAAAAAPRGAGRVQPHVRVLAAAGVGAAFVPGDPLVPAAEEPRLQPHRHGLHGHGLHGVRRRRRAVLTVGHPLPLRGGARGGPRGGPRGGGPAQSGPGPDAAPGVERRRLRGPQRRRRAVLRVRTPSAPDDSFCA